MSVSVSAVFVSLSVFLTTAVARAAPGNVEAWQHTATLRAPTPVPFAGFGGAVDIDGDTCVIGAPEQPGGGFAYVFTRSPTGIWFLQSVLSPADPGGKFGTVVAVEGDRIAVGAPIHFHEPIGGAGAVFVFERSGTTWTQKAELLASDPHSNDSFGGSVALDGDTLVVAAGGGDGVVANTGCVYVFTHAGGVWTEAVKLFAADGSAGDAYGTSVALDGDTLLVGTPRDSDLGTLAGAAYVLTGSGATWTQQTKLFASDASAFDGFGGVSLSGDTAAIGAPTANPMASSEIGAVYVFTRTGATWTEQAALHAPDAEPDDRFGVGLEVKGDRLVATALFNDAMGNASGAAYVFERNAATWTQTAKLIPTDGSASDDDTMGAVGLSGDTLIVGAHGDGGIPSVTQSGSAFAFRLRLQPGTPFCFGDDNSEAIHCPCNATVTGAPFAGCRNSAHNEGAWLSAIGTTSPNSVTFVCRFLPQNAFCVLLRSATANPAGQVFGDGVRCLQYGDFLFLPQSFQAVGSIASTSVHDVAPGQTRHYQVMYRDPTPSCAPATFNISNAYTIVW